MPDGSLAFGQADGLHAWVHLKNGPRSQSEHGWIRRIIKARAVAARGGPAMRVLIFTKDGETSPDLAEFGLVEAPKTG